MPNFCVAFLVGQYANLSSLTHSHSCRVASYHWRLPVDMACHISRSPMQFVVYGLDPGVFEYNVNISCSLFYTVLPPMPPMSWILLTAKKVAIYL